MRAAWPAVLALALLGHACGAPAPTTPTPQPTPVAGPSLTCPAPMAVTTTAATTTVTWEVPVPQGGVAPVTVACTPAPGQSFAAGTTEVRCAATDAGGRSASCTFTVSVARQPTLTATRFLAFGDSVTLGIVAVENPARDPFYILTPVPGDAYPVVLAQRLAGRYATQPVTVVNAGKGGEKAVDGIGRLSGEIGTHRPDVLLLLDGYNDLGLGAVGLAPGLAAINEMVKVARFRGVRVFLSTLTPPNRNGTRGLSSSLVTAFNAGLRDIARGENAVLVDVHAALAADPNRYNSDDGRHPNVEGYRAIAEVFFDAIRAELEAR